MGKGSGDKKTKQTQDFKLPKWYEDAAKQVLDFGKGVASNGYTPYIGPDVAALSPSAEAGIQGTDAMSAAFGMPTSGGTGYLPAAQTSAGGVKGYSSFPGFEESMNNLKTKFPGVYEFLSKYNKGMGADAMNSPAMAQSFNPTQATGFQDKLDPNFNKLINLTGIGGGGFGGKSKGPFKPA